MKTVKDRSLGPFTVTDRTNWTEISYVLASRRDLAFTGLRRTCVGCGEDVLIGRAMRYPDDVRFICIEVCALHIMGQESAS
jgi:hypothetical protein